MSIGTGTNTRRAGFDPFSAGGVSFATATFGLPSVGHFSTSSAGVSSAWNQPISQDDVTDGSEGSAIETAHQIIELRETSGLTIDQLGRLFGVSRRSVHNWLNGKPMAPRHEEQLGYILSTVRSLPGASRQERRSQLLASRDGGSLFQALHSTAPRDVTIQVAANTPRDLTQL